MVRVHRGSAVHVPHTDRSLAFLVAVVMLAGAQLILAAHYLAGAAWSRSIHSACWLGRTGTALASMVPGATKNALASLIVPIAVFFLAQELTVSEHRRTLTLLFVLIAGAALATLAQISGASFDNPLIHVSSEPGMSFANRNHLALFLAIGCLIAPVWALHGRHARRWQLLLASGALPVFVLVILATGSRAGLRLGVRVGGGARPA